MAALGDGLKDIFLAGIGALAITGEKSKELVDQLISKGELTVDQGKQINTELKHKAEETAATLRYDALEARMAALSPEERMAFAAKAAEFAAKANAAEAQGAEVGAATEVSVETPEPGAQVPAADGHGAEPAGQTPDAAGQTPVD